MGHLGPRCPDVKSTLQDCHYARLQLLLDLFKQYSLTDEEASTAILLFLLPAIPAAAATATSALPLPPPADDQFSHITESRQERPFIAPNAAVLGATQESVSQLAHSVSLTSFI